MTAGEGNVPEEARLREFLRALAYHGWTVWPNTTCGRGGVGGWAMTTTPHLEVIQHLVSFALSGRTLAEAADAYEAMLPDTVRLDCSPGRSGRAGPDGRPL